MNSVKQSIITTVFLLIFFVSAIGSFRLYLKQLEETRRVNGNFQSAMKSLTYYKTKAGNQAARADVLQLRYDELRNTYPEIVKSIKDLQLKVSKAEIYSETHVNTELRIKTQIRDSLIYDTIKVRAFGYVDTWNHVTGYILDDSINMNIRHTDSIIQVISKSERYRPWLWILSKRKLQQSITASDPNSTIKYSRTIQLKKR